MKPRVRIGRLSYVNTKRQANVIFLKMKNKNEKVESGAGYIGQIQIDRGKKRLEKIMF